MAGRRGASGNAPGEVKREAGRAAPGSASTEPARRWIYPEGPQLSRCSGCREDERPRAVLGRLLSDGVV